MAWHGKASQGMACRAKARQGKEMKCNTMHGMAWHGSARHGMEIQVKVGKCKARQGEACQCMARQCLGISVDLGMERQGKTRKGKEMQDMER
jgi:hypothetical protein